MIALPSRGRHRRSITLRIQRTRKRGRIVRIKISSGSTSVYAQLNDTPTTRKLAEALPCTSAANTWGKEVYFSIPVAAVLEPDARQVVEPGTVGFWVEGAALALPFGPTPISHGDECRLVTRVNILGRIEGDPSVLDNVRDGDQVRVEQA